VPDGALVAGAVTGTLVAGTLVAGTLVAGTCCAELAVARPIKKDAAKRTTIARAPTMTRMTCVRDVGAATGAATVVVFMTSPFGSVGIGEPTRLQDRLGGGLGVHRAPKETSRASGDLLRSHVRTTYSGSQNPPRPVD
jgi:hypothetical protein